MSTGNHVYIHPIGQTKAVQKKKKTSTIPYTILCFIACNFISSAATIATQDYKLIIFIENILYLQYIKEY